MNFQNLYSSEAINSNNLLSLNFLSPIKTMSLILAFFPKSMSIFNTIELNSLFSSFVTFISEK